MSVITKLIVVEGKRDKERLLEVLNEPVHIICTHGTMGVTKFDEMYEDLHNHTVYIMTDQDKAGKKIRAWFKHHLSEGKHIYIDSKYGEVGNCPVDYLARVMASHGFETLLDWSHWKESYNEYEHFKPFRLRTAY